MKQMLTDLKLPLLLMILIGFFAALSMPIMPIDETRYVSVAWEMWNHHSFLVPHLNGELYTHKPPLLFWLIQAGWKLFSVNDFTPRLTPVFFSLLNLMLVYRISRRLWPQERTTAMFATLVLVSTAIWAVWSVAIMFDIILAFWILLGMLGTLRAAEKCRGGWLMLAAGVAGGLLTKGPAVLVYLLPVALFRAWWDVRREQPVRTAWYVSILGAAALGFAIALLWAIPAVIQGGEIYRNDILWGQTAGRIASSAAHHRPVWWYLPILPLFFFPWILFRPAFSKIQLKTADAGTRFCLTWLGLPFLIFSMISGKQIHYLIPFIPAGALLIGRNIARTEELSGKISLRVIAVLFLLFGLTAWGVQFIDMGGDLGPLDAGDTRFITTGFMMAGLLLLLPFHSSTLAARRITLCTVLILFCTFFQCKEGFMDSFNIKDASVFLKTKMDEGLPVANMGQYHGQYHFLGRLTQPITELDKKTDTYEEFESNHPGTLFISYQQEDEDTLPEKAKVCFTHEYRGENVVFWQFPGQREAIETD